jgi:hypothetical protein
MKWDDLIDQAFVDLNVIQVGEAITTAMRTDARNRFNQLLSSLSTEGLTAFNQTTGTFPLVSGLTNYTLGVGGMFNIAVRAQRVTAWRATFGGILSSGGRALSLEEFGASAMQAQPAGETAPIPKILGADTAYPLINIRILPPPGASPGLLELAYWTPITQVTDFTADISGVPEGWQQMLHFNLAVALSSQYTRGGISQELAANAQNSKASLVSQNAPAAPHQQQAA